MDDSFDAVVKEPEREGDKRKDRKRIRTEEISDDYQGSLSLCAKDNFDTLSSYSI